MARTRLAGVVVGQRSPFELFIDDGTGSVVVRFFDKPLSVAVGDSVVIIGKPRVFGEEKQVVAEIARKLLTADALSFFSSSRKDLQSFIPEAPKVEEEVVTSQVDVEQKVFVPKEKTTSTAQLLIATIRELDPGDGAPTDEVLSKVNLPGTEQKLEFLIAEGEVFELRAGKIKVLE
ncbi:OB-fold nucleic acid binding domain-containing protein [Candidatus Woesearchaeota archaeon]|nr:OB-fold nucleic acid binding domain-containing protein [Candidatus Woesearchaeota archaeon]